MDHIAMTVLFNSLLIVPLVVLGLLGRRTSVSPRLLHVFWTLVLVKMVMPTLWAATWTVPETVVSWTQTWSGETASNGDNKTNKVQRPAAKLATSPQDAGIASPASPASPPSHDSAAISPADSVDKVEPSTTKTGDVTQLPSKVATRTHSIRGAADRHYLIWCSLLISAILAVRVVLAHCRLLKWVRRGERGEGLLQDRVTEVAGSLGITRLPEVIVVDGRLSPFVTAGLTKCYLVLPRGLLSALTPESMRLMLAHELAHLSRRDLWSRRLSALVCCLYWWHPLVWWVSQAAREAEDESCDRAVVLAYPNRRREYAESLLTAVDFLSGELTSNVLDATTAPAVPPATVCGFVRFRGIKRRMQMLSGKETKRASKLWSLCVLATVVLVLPLTVDWTIGNEPPSKAAKRKERRAKRAAASDLQVDNTDLPAATGIDDVLNDRSARLTESPAPTATATASTEDKRARRMRRKQNSTKLAFVDVAQVFRESKEFKSDMNALKEEIKKTEADMKKAREELQKLHATRTQAPVGSPEYKDAEADLHKRSEAMKRSMTEARARFMKSESKIYHSHYTRIYDLIGDHAKQEGFKAVFRSPDGKGKSVQQSLNPRSIDPIESSKIIATLNQNLLFVDGDNPDSVDITAAIITKLNAPQEESADLKNVIR